VQDFWHRQHSYEDVWTCSNPHERSTRSGFKEDLLLLGALEALGYKFSCADEGIKVTKGSIMILKERTTNLCKLTESIIVGDALAATEEDTTRVWHMRLGHMSERGLQALHKISALSGIKYCKLDVCKFCIMGRQRRVAFSTSQHETKGLQDLIHTNVWGLCYFHR